VYRLQHGETTQGRDTISVEREGAVVVIRGGPADVCASCGEEYVEAAVMKSWRRRVGQEVTDCAEAIALLALASRLAMAIANPVTAALQGRSQRHQPT
jgi:YgiT-type zinc finger domain-containing protein